MTIQINNISFFGYERKFRVDELTKEEVELIIKKNVGHFNEIFHQRVINNIYLDTQSFSNYTDNLDGIPEKIKIRIRWYGNTFGLIKNPHLEIKMRNEFLVNKRKYPLNDFKIDNDFSLDDLKKNIISSKVPNRIKEEIKSLRFSLFNTYIRKYFMSAHNVCRLTIDSDMRFIYLSKNTNLFLKRARDDAIIVELKYNKNKDNIISMFSSEFPFRMTKCSKYAIGIDKLNMNNLY
ncbi:VTC domain-containing protein [Candidatus Woesearchaeota archaeon]|nr:VTC domain-containing protein [Candidatus Woesearchaeota archaeon]